MSLVAVQWVWAYPQFRFQPALNACAPVTYVAFIAILLNGYCVQLYSPPPRYVPGVPGAGFCSTTCTKPAGMPGLIRLPHASGRYTPVASKSRRLVTGDDQVAISTLSGRKMKSCEASTAVAPPAV